MLGSCAFVFKSPVNSRTKLCRDAAFVSLRNTLHTAISLVKGEISWEAAGARPLLVFSLTQRLVLSYSIKIDLNIVEKNQPTESQRPGVKWWMSLLSVTEEKTRVGPAPRALLTLELL